MRRTKSVSANKTKGWDLKRAMSFDLKKSKDADGAGNKGKDARRPGGGGGGTTSSSDTLPDPNIVTTDIRRALLELPGKYCDVDLISNEGERIPANRALLAMRSSHFDSLLYSADNSPTSGDVPIDLDTRSLRECLQFAYTGDSNLVRKFLLFTDKRKQRELKRTHVAGVLDIARAAHQVSLDGLFAWCKTALKRVMEKSPRITCMLLRAQRLQNFTYISHDRLVRNLVESPRECFRVPDCIDFDVNDRVQEQFGVLDLTSDDLKVAIQRLADQEDSDHEYLFQVVYYWATKGKVLRETTKASALAALVSREDARWVSARAIIRHSDLTEMRPLFVVRYVEGCGLADSRAVMRAYRTDVANHSKELKPYRPRRQRFDDDDDLGKKKAHSTRSSADESFSSNPLGEGNRSGAFAESNTRRSGLSFSCTKEDDLAVVAEGNMTLCLDGMHRRVAMDSLFFARAMRIASSLAAAKIHDRFSVRGCSSGMDTAAPCRTLYVRNLPDKLNKTKLRRLLHAAMSPYGNVVWIVAEKTMKLRGQAFLTFETQAEATTALRKMHAAEFMGRQISITYAKSISDRAASPRFGGDSTASQKERAATRRDKAAEVARAEAEEAAAKAAQAQQALLGQGVPPGNEAPAQVVTVPVPTPPNRILFVENLPKEIGEEEGGKPLPVATALTDLFARFAGFIEVRTVAGKDGIAFVEFEAEAESAIAMSGLQDHPLGKPPQPMKITFAKK